MTESVVIDEESVVRCSYGDGKKANHTLRVEGQGIFVVCTPCDKLLKAKNKKKRCKYCGVPILGDWKSTPIGNFEHQYNCPRNPEPTELIEVG